jgi:hypothetical protein
MKEKEQGWKEYQGIQNIDIKDSERNTLVDKRQVMNIWG